MVPIQVGGIGILVVLLIFIIWVGVAAIGGYLVYQDAMKRRNENALLWGIVIAILFLLGLIPGLLGVIIYLLLRK